VDPRAKPELDFFTERLARPRAVRPDQDVGRDHPEGVTLAPRLRQVPNVISSL